MLNKRGYIFAYRLPHSAAATQGRLKRFSGLNTLAALRRLRNPPLTTPSPRRATGTVGSIRQQVAALILALFATVVGTPEPTEAQPRPQLAKCVPGQARTADEYCLVDGDTIWIDGEKLRMEGYDTPEPQTQICGGDAEVALAHRVSDRVIELLNSNDWTVEYGEPDNTGTRTLVTIRIGGRDIGDILIAERLARSWPDGEEWWCRR
jgi:endonuclease YncB( thermonuclease family)